MLESLLIRNIALFEEARIDFGPGLHVLTEETGAGKSLVVDAVNFLCGAKTDKSL
ncbi:MAG TPA: AAA family ATPase, partial [Clostridia bacterium]|nr:AAA family ATPase [Clostridia bacterium]